MFRHSSFSRRSFSAISWRFDGVRFSPVVRYGPMLVYMGSLMNRM